jgi:DNA-binding MarR family transcriptional regulator
MQATDKNLFLPHQGKADSMHSRRSLGKQILKSIPSVMRVIRREMMPIAAGQLSIPQFRILAHLSHGEETVSSLAQLQGVSLPAISKMLDGLVAKKMVRKKACANDRRSQWAELLPKGRKIFDRMQEQVAIKLNEQLATLSSSDTKVIEEALQILYLRFAARKSNGMIEIKNAL